MLKSHHSSLDAPHTLFHKQGTHTRKPAFFTSFFIQLILNFVNYLQQTVQQKLFFYKTNKITFLIQEVNHRGIKDGKSVQIKFIFPGGDLISINDIRKGLQKKAFNTYKNIILRPLN
jgi:hypothetical protein